MSGTNLDPSISLRVGQGVAQPQNPLATFGQYQSIQNALTQNRALETGIAGQEQQQKLQRIGIFGQVVGGILAEHPNGVPAGAVASGAANLLSMGALKRDEIGPLLQDLPMGDDPTSVAQRTSMLRQFLAQASSVSELNNRVRGAPTMVDVGGEKVPGMLSERGFSPTQGDLTNTLPPGTATDIVQVPVMGPDGKPTGATEPVTRAEAAQRGGLGGTISPGAFGPANGRYSAPAAPASATPAPTASPAPTTPAPSSAMPTASPPPPVAPAPVSRSGSYGATLSPGAVTAQTANAAEGVKMGTELTRQGDAVPQQKAMLGEMEAALEGFTSGKGQQSILNFKSYIQSLAPERVAAALGVDPDTIKSAETFNKLATQVALQQGAALGVNTDAARANLFGGNPNMDLSKLGNRQIIHMLQGNADAIAAKAQAWAESPYRASGDYASFSNAWNRNFDPRVFQWAYMTGPERQDMLRAAGKDSRQLADKLRAIYGSPR